MSNALVAISMLVIAILLLGCTSTDNTAQPPDSPQNITSNFTSNQTSNSTANLSANLTPPKEISFNITNCSVGIYDFAYSGSEYKAASLHCVYATNLNCEGHSAQEIPQVTLVSPSGENLTSPTYCSSVGDLYQARMAHLRMANEWTTPPAGTYKLVVTSSGHPIYIYNLTFLGYNLSAASLSGTPTYSKIFKGYMAYDQNLDYMNLTFANSGDLPVFTDDVQATLDGKNASVMSKYLGIAPGRSLTIQFGWDGYPEAGSHILIVKTFDTSSSTANQLSENALKFDIPSMGLVQ